MNGFVWFSSEDIAIVGDDICSKCKLTLPEDEVPLMLFREHAGGAVDVARFHEHCFKELVQAGVI